jgi:cysteine desulfurase / selenocysteine lyase
MQMEIEALRRSTPGCELNAFFNHSGASLPSLATLETARAHLEREALYGPMEASLAAADELQETRCLAEELIGAKTDEVAFTTSASAAIGLTFAALPPLQRGDRILVGRHEWGGNVSTFSYAAARAGATVEVIPCDDDGSVSARALAAMIDERVRLVSLTWVPANGGLVNDAKAIGEVTSAAQVPYFIDAGQVLGQLPVDVQELRCDVLKGTGRKFLRAPRGTAILYVRKEFAAELQPVFVDVQSAPFTQGHPQVRHDARMFETIEGPVALLLGLGQALREARDIGVPRIAARVRVLADTLRQQLRDIKGVRVHDLGRTQCGLVSLTVDGLPMAEVKGELGAMGIIVGGNGVAYTPFDMAARGLQAVVRASISYFNTEHEIDRLAKAVGQLQRKAGT